MCQGYYRHSEGYTPDWEGMEHFKGRIVHPQTWPEDLDYAGKNVVVIGSGATAATLIPAIAADCAHVTMLQRSPTYFRTGRNAIELADELRELQIDEAWIHEIVRRKILHDQSVFTRRSFTEPEIVKAGTAGGEFAPTWVRTTIWQRTSRRATGRGGSASPLFRTATFCRRSAPARPRSSPTRSRASPRPAFC